MHIMRRKDSRDPYFARLRDGESILSVAPIAKAVFVPRSTHRDSTAWEQEPAAEEEAKSVAPEGPLQTRAVPNRLCNLFGTGHPERFRSKFLAQSRQRQPMQALQAHAQHEY